jgi:hypothetical protein
MSITSSIAPSSRHGRRIIWLAVAVVLASAAYSAAWFAIADRIESEVDAGFKRNAATGGLAECDNLSARGYPFRFGFFCDAVSYSTADRRITVSTGAFRSAAQVYEPSQVVGELDGPVLFDGPGFVPIRLDWENLRFSLQHDYKRAESASLEVRGGLISLRQSAGLSDPVARSDTAELHMRTRGQALDIAVDTRGVRSADERLQVPPVDLVADLTLEQGAPYFQDGTRPSLRGQTIDIRSLKLATRQSDGASVAISGPLVISETGLATGTLSIVATDVSAIAALIASAVPNEAERIIAAAQTVSALERDGQIKLDITIRDNDLYAGFIPLGTLPAFQ